MRTLPESLAQNHLFSSKMLLVPGAQQSPPTLAGMVLRRGLQWSGGSYQTSWPIASMLGKGLGPSPSLPSVLGGWRWAGA